MLPNATAKAECNVPVFAHRILSAVSENACHSFVWAPGRRFLAETKPARRCIIVCNRHPARQYRASMQSRWQVLIPLLYGWCPHSIQDFKTLSIEIRDFRRWYCPRLTRLQSSKSPKFKRDFVVSCSLEALWHLITIQLSSCVEEEILNSLKLRRVRHWCCQTATLDLRHAGSYLPSTGLDHEAAFSLAEALHTQKSGRDSSIQRNSGLSGFFIFF